MKRSLFGTLLVALFFVACSGKGANPGKPELDADMESSSSSDLAESSSSSEEVVQLSSSSVTTYHSLNVPYLPPCRRDTIIDYRIESIDNCEYGTLVDDRDGQTYKTVKIGERWWMAENLSINVENSFWYADSTNSCDTFYGKDYYKQCCARRDTIGLFDEQYADREWRLQYLFSDSSSEIYEICSNLGRLYLWTVAVDSAGLFSDDAVGCGGDSPCLSKGNVRGICPEGWHLPSKDEYDTLMAMVRIDERPILYDSYDGLVLNSRYDWVSDWTCCKNSQSYLVSAGGSDGYGFSASPAGSVSFGLYRDSLHWFYHGVGKDAEFWTSTNYGNGPYSVELDNSCYIATSGSNSFMAVRCVKD